FRVADLESALASGKPGDELQGPVETANGDALFVYRIRKRLPARTPKLDEVRDRVREALLRERAFDRARWAAERFVAEVTTATARFDEVAAAWGVTEKETPLLGRDDAGDAGKLGELAAVGQPFVAALFDASELGAVFGPIEDAKARVAYVGRWVRRQPAPADGFAAERLRLYTELEPKVGAQWVEHWQLDARLEAREIGDDVLRELYTLRYGKDGLEAVEARRIHIPADKETISTMLEARALRLAREALEKIVNDPHPSRAFARVARRQSEDEGTRRRGGSLGWFRRGQMVKPFEDAAFGAAIGEIVGPIKTRFGYHLILVTDKEPTRVRAKHILFRTERGVDRTTGQPRPLPPEVLEAAMQKAREKAERALARLEAGEEFVAVGRALGADAEALSVQPYPYLTALEEAVIGAEDKKLTGPVAIDGRFALLLTEAIGPHGGRSVTEQPRLAYGILAGDRGKLERLRAQLEEKREEILKDKREVRRAFYPLRDAFEELAAEECEGPIARVRGVLGRFDPPVALLRFGPALRKALYTLKPGERSGIIETPESFEIVLVTGHRKRSFEQARPEVSRSLLAALER
ncbi:MAG: hypothetical protein D6776_11980, partial [Planctomycetota bacterium]